MLSTMVKQPRQSTTAQQMGKIALKMACKETPSDYRAAKMAILCDLVVKGDHGRITDFLKKSPENSEYFAALLLNGANIRMETGVDMFTRVENALVKAYRNGADLSDLMATLEQMLSAPNSPYVARAYSAFRVMEGMLDSKEAGLPLKSEIARVLTNAAAKLGKEGQPTPEQEDLRILIQARLVYAMMDGVKMPNGLKTNLLGRALK